MIHVIAVRRASLRATLAVARRVPARLAAIDLLGAPCVVARARPSALDTLYLTRPLPARLANPSAHVVVGVLVVIRARRRATKAIARRVAARLAAIHLLGASCVIARAKPSALETEPFAFKLPARLA